LLVIAASIASSADTSPTARRDKTLAKVNACIRRNEVSSRQCRKLDEHLKTLIEVYQGGDKSVLPTLFRFTYLTDFYGDALIADPYTFLTNMAQLSKENQLAVARGVSGGMFRLRSRERFEAVRVLLMGIPDSFPAKETARACLKALETNNASLFVNYFPPQAFTSRAADFQLYWYSRDMYALGEKPLWPTSSTSPTSYRFTHLGAFTDPQVATLTVHPDGTGRIAIRTVTEDWEATSVDEVATIPQDQLARFFTRLDDAHFWEMPTELSSRGLDGAEWILEGVRDGRYHAVVRWCPDAAQHAEESAFADAGRLLFELAGHKHPGCC